MATEKQMRKHLGTAILMGTVMQMKKRLGRENQMEKQMRWQMHLDLPMPKDLMMHLVKGMHYQQLMLV
jgi:hypothetical protein